MPKNRHLPAALALIAATVIFPGSSSLRLQTPAGRAPIVEPKIRFGQGRLFVPSDIRIFGTEVIILDEVAPMTPGDNIFVVFDMKGKWKSEFGRGGQGPGEFGQAHSFEIKRNILCVLDSYKQCLHEFDVRDKHFIKTIRYGSEQVITTPHDFTLLDNGGFVLARPLGIRGNKTLFPFSPEGKPGTPFLNVLPVAETIEEFIAKARKQDTEQIRITYVNLGYLESSGGKIAYLSWLKNEILVFDMDGKEAGRITLPLPSLEKTVRIVNEGEFRTIERRLNYGLKCEGDRIWVLSRDENGISILFEIAGGRVIERLRAREDLTDFDLAEGKMYALDRESGEVLVYPLPPVR